MRARFHPLARRTSAALILAALAWLAAGCTFTFIQESYATRAQEGYTAGVNDAHYADAQVDGVGYPVSCAVAYCASDGNAGNPGPDAAPAIQAEDPFDIPVFAGAEEGIDRHDQQGPRRRQQEDQKRRG